MTFCFESALGRGLRYPRYQRHERHQRNTHSSFLRLCFLGGLGLTLLSGSATAMPGAPMMKLVDLTPACTSDPRAVVLHESFGRTYPNDLPDWAEVVVRTVESLERSGTLAQHTATLNRRVLNAAETPLPGSAGVTLPRATASRTFRIPLPPEAASALRGLRSSGREEGLSGLSSLSSLVATSRPARTLLLINADDPTQLVWGTQERKAALEARRIPARIVVSVGTVATVREALVAAGDPDPRAWGDQGGTIRRRVGVTHLPARITTDPEGILVEEVALDDSGCPIPTIPAEERSNVERSE